MSTSFALVESIQETPNQAKRPSAQKIIEELWLTDDSLLTRMREIPQQACLEELN